MEEDFRVFVRKAAKILADAPPYANNGDKIAILNRKFRLNKKDGELLLKEICKENL